MAEGGPELRITDTDGTYADRLTVVYRGVDDRALDTDIGPAIVFITHPGGSRLAIEPLRRELERLARGADGTARSFISSVRIGHTSWGADAATVTFLLTVAGQVTGEFIAMGLRRVGAAIRRGASGRASEQRPITEEEATYWADAMLRARFDGIEIAKLDVTALRLKPLGATVRLAGEDGCRYSVELELADGLVAVGEVWRTYPGEATDPPSA